MNLLQKAWEEYREQVFPDGASVEQNDQAYQAFVAGAMETFATIRVLSDLPEPQRVIELFHDEIKAAVTKITLSGPDGSPRA